MKLGVFVYFGRFHISIDEKGAVALVCEEEEHKSSDNDWKNKFPEWEAASVNTLASPQKAAAAAAAGFSL